MGRRCIVQGCRRDKDTPLKTFGIPTIRKSDEAITTRRQILWLKRLNLFGKKQSIKDVRVCDAHFLSGKPSYYMDEINPDWAPSQNIGSINFVSKSAYERYKRRKKSQTKKAKMTQCLLKGKVIYHTGQQPSAVCSPSTHAPLDTDSFVPKEVKVIKEKITHQMPDVSKKPEKVTEVLNKDQLDLVWRHKQPVGTSSQVGCGEVVKIGESHPSKVAQLLEPNGKEPEAPGKLVGNEESKPDQGGKDDQGVVGSGILSAPAVVCHQMVRNNRIFFISSNTTHDHDYCEKPTYRSVSPKSALERTYHIDHDYCRTPPSYGPLSTVENDSNSSHILPQAEAPIQNSREVATIDIDKITSGESGQKSTTRTDAVYDFILPDVVTEGIGSICNRCAEDVSHLKLELEQKSTTLVERQNNLNSLKRELELAKEHINNLRAQLEENTHTLCSYISIDGKSS